jgi:zinc/manganese transport system ATP-binding protein
MNVIDLDRASIRIRDRTVLSDITISVGAGEFIGVLGPNGSGKTTLMRALLGLIKPSSGTIHVFGRPPQRGDAAIGYVPQVRSRTADARLGCCRQLSSR